ncbi:MAG: DUF4058 family protein [Gemmataceae bacterium]
MHDWTRVEPTIYHHFHQQWSAAIADELNAGRLPSGLSALLEQRAGGPSPDVLTVDVLKRANRIAIWHRLKRVVCIIEIVSPGNKASRHAVNAFVEKTHEFLRAGVNVLLIDPFPPGPRDPHSLHELIWDEYEDVPFELPAGEPLLLAAYRAADRDAGASVRADLEPLAVGAAIPDMPAWIDSDSFVEVPLEPAYRAAWDASPADYRFLVEHGRLPDEG